MVDTGMFTFHSFYGRERALTPSMLILKKMIFFYSGLSKIRRCLALLAQPSFPPDTKIVTANEDNICIQYFSRSVQTKREKCYSRTREHGYKVTPPLVGIIHRTSLIFDMTCNYANYGSFLNDVFM